MCRITSNRTDTYMNKCAKKEDARTRHEKFWGLYTIYYIKIPKLKPPVGQPQMWSVIGERPDVENLKQKNKNLTVRFWYGTGLNFTLL